MSDTAVLPYKVKNMDLAEIGRQNDHRIEDAGDEGPCISIRDADARRAAQAGFPRDHHRFRHGFRRRFGGLANKTRHEGPLPQILQREKSNCADRP